jgi:hypothetical protein
MTTLLLILSFTGPVLGFSATFAAALAAILAVITFV